MAERRDGTIWVGTSAGIAVYASGRFTRYTTADGLPSDVVLSLAEDAAGVLWAGTAKGLARLDHGRFEPVADPLVPKHPISALVPDGSALWVGSKGGGVVRYDQGRAQRFTMRDGLASNFILSIERCESGAIWIGSSGAPLTRYYQGEFTTFGSAEDTATCAPPLHTDSSVHEGFFSLNLPP